MKENNKSVQQFISDPGIPEDKRVEMIRLRTELDDADDAYQIVRSRIIQEQTLLIREQDEIKFGKKLPKIIRAMKITVQKVEPKRDLGFIPYNGFYESEPRQPHKSFREDRECARKFDNALVTWSWFTSTTMFVARLGMPSVIPNTFNDYSYYLKVKGRRGTMLINFDGERCRARVTRDMSRKTRMHLARAIEYDVMYHTIPSTRGTLVQVEPGSRIFKFDNFAAIANGHYNIKEIELDCERHLYEPWTNVKREESNDNKVRNTIQR